MRRAVSDLALDKMSLVRSREMLAKPVSDKAPMDHVIRKWPFPETARRRLRASIHDHEALTVRALALL